MNDKINHCSDKVCSESINDNDFYFIMRTNFTEVSEYKEFISAAENPFPLGVIFSIIDHYSEYCSDPKEFSIVSNNSINVGICRFMIDEKNKTINVLN